MQRSVGVYPLRRSIPIMNRQASFVLGLMRPVGLAIGLGWCVWAGGAQAGDTTPAAQLQRWSVAAGASGQAERGKAFFASRHGGEWSCSTCHNAPPTQEGKHPVTGKTVPVLAPAFNDKAFTDTAKVDKWFRRNCKDVASRECTAQEKADVLAYLLTLSR
jgi:cytochrome c553